VREETSCVLDMDCATSSSPYRSRRRYLSFAITFFFSLLKDTRRMGVPLYEKEEK